jgi:dihydrofolate synthase/folylpolyglutamate synthase
LAFQKFHLSQCEAVVLEVGLGGRLDATNIVTPHLSIITAVQFDHMSILGNTIEEIASEKAGIMKPNVPVLVGPGCPQDYMKEKAKSLNAPFHTIDSVLSSEQRLFNIESPIYSDTDYLNSDLAHAALRIIHNLQSASSPGNSSSSSSSSALATKLNPDSEAVKQSLMTRPICRFEEFEVAVPSEERMMKMGQGKIKVILDLAHNIEAIKALVSRTHAHYPDSDIK